MIVTITDLVAGFMFEDDEQLESAIIKLPEFGDAIRYPSEFMELFHYAWASDKANKLEFACMATDIYKAARYISEQYVRLERRGIIK